VIQSNEGDVEAEGDFTAPRPAPPIAPPRCLATPLLAHQADGLQWLQRARSAGRPGVLLADDMGLGKTLQGLAFLAWLRDGMEVHTIARAPLLIVAPTGLLQNWRAEHDKYLRAPGLGRCTEAFGRGLAALNRRSEDGRPGLEPKAISASDWVLTTYETLRDYDKDFGRVRFAAVIFDEAQNTIAPA
jgi:SNF2 family DNA or RNA helicase